ncbi:MAG: hypothetical protein JXB15_00325 [Anaerolineales bacterium]|nr:hypothetical protein [Anaerolineales bacterium]
MSAYFMGVDVGSTKTHALIADETGRLMGFGASGPGNHEVVGYEGLQQAIQLAAAEALTAAALHKDQISGAGFGVAGFDWPSEKANTIQAIDTLGFSGAVEAVNDTDLGLLAGSEEGWGIAVVSGTGTNCRGWDRTRQRRGMVTGAGLYMGEAAGASELVYMSVRALSHEWSRRGPATALAPALVKLTGAKNLDDLLEGLINNRYQLSPSAAPLIFEIAAQGDRIAQELIHWAGFELGEQVKAVARQLSFENLAFDVVMIGSMFNGGPMLIEPMQDNVRSLAPQARFVRLASPPVAGAVLLGMDICGMRTLEARQNLLDHLTKLKSPL